MPVLPRKTRVGYIAQEAPAGDATPFETVLKAHPLGGLVQAVSGGASIYAPVGAHRDLLAYLVRRLLENGANSSFVHQIVDESVTPEEVARDSIVTVGQAIRREVASMGDGLERALARAGELRVRQTDRNAFEFGVDQCRRGSVVRLRCSRYTQRTRFRLGCRWPFE